MTAHVEVMELVARLKAAEETFVLATVVRTVSVTAAKAGAKAIIRPDGTIVAGWIGGGCARGAVLKAAREALADSEPRMVSVQPENLLGELGGKPGENRGGGRAGRSRTASRAWSRCSRKIFWPNSASSPARTATACASQRICARAKAPWISSSSRCCRIPRW